ncbi:MAG: NAD(P)/FAD-dependent oxidoreductase [Labilithrix sp.]|nr:NAD(P)/FAD-dependent oxidoreductase [Labilithrix sp.]MBX3221283.1 NAD(P)/FAD-dependent oxidoreductase [Labilithrix sp.]
MSKAKRRVVIVGGGFGGLEAAKALASADVDILLVDRVNYHLFQPLLYQVAMAGLAPSEIASPIRGILAEQKNLRVVLGEVTGVDLAAKRIHITDPGTHGDLVEDYDWLVLAVGARNGYFGHDQWEPYAPGLKTVEDALEIRRRVLVAFERAEKIDDARERKKLLTFVVIGGGPTGVEMSGAVAELARYVLAQDFRSADPRETKVVLIEAGPRILPSFPEDLAASAVEQLAELGVEVMTQSRVVSIDGDGVVLEGEGADDVPGLGSGSGRDRIHAATVLWGAGVRASALTECLDVPRDRQGRVIVGPDCALPDHPDVFAIGDMARFEEKGQVLPGVSPVAMQQGRYVARIIRWEAESDGRPPRSPFSYFDKGSMATIGRSRAIAWARGIKMTGFIAWLAWLFIHIFYLIGFKNRLVVLFNWFWSYLSYKRGARLITSTGWEPTAAKSLACAVPALPPKTEGRTVPGAERAPESARAGGGAPISHPRP